MIRSFKILKEPFGAAFWKKLKSRIWNFDRNLNHFCKLTQSIQRVGFGVKKPSPPPSNPMLTLISRLIIQLNPTPVRIVNFAPFFPWTRTFSFKIHWNFHPVQDLFTIIIIPVYTASINITETYPNYPPLESSSPHFFNLLGFFSMLCLWIEQLTTSPRSHTIRLNRV